VDFANNHKDKTIDSNDIARFPTADVEPVIHGKWIDTDFVNSTGEIYECSNCRKFYNPSKKAVSLGRQADNPTYCPNCGAKMGESESPKPLSHEKG
jgi:DNA-directed RNA polymerase subunit RPC12/RpoP